MTEFVHVTKYHGFTIADEGYPRGTTATFQPLGWPEAVILHAGPDERIEDKIEDWWLENEVIVAKAKEK